MKKAKYLERKETEAKRMQDECLIGEKEKSKEESELGAMEDAKEDVIKDEEA